MKKTNNEHIENDFPTLEGLKGENGMKTPEGYFDTLHNSIMSKVEVKKKTKTISLYRVLGYAASVAVIVGVSSVFLFNSSNPSLDDEFGSLTVAEYMDDLEEIDLELDEELRFDEMAMNVDYEIEY